mmetsp:Transcript_97115/g.142104  ORF Transcript_97115/g.142104 Transcript_97115/m.142104 type:complete len:402 (-) Transcript_97115:1141-2346(-)
MCSPCRTDDVTNSNKSFASNPVPARELAADTALSTDMLASRFASKAHTFASVAPEAKVVSAATNSERRAMRERNSHVSRGVPRANARTSCTMCAADKEPLDTSDDKRLASALTWTVTLSSGHMGCLSQLSASIPHTSSTANNPPSRCFAPAEPPPRMCWGERGTSSAAAFTSAVAASPSSEVTNRFTVAVPVAAAADEVSRQRESAAPTPALSAASGSSDSPEGGTARSRSARANRSAAEQVISFGATSWAILSHKATNSGWWRAPRGEPRDFQTCAMLTRTPCESLKLSCSTRSSARACNPEFESRSSTRIFRLDSALCSAIACEQAPLTDGGCFCGGEGCGGSAILRKHDVTISESSVCRPLVCVHRIISKKAIRGTHPSTDWRALATAPSSHQAGVPA